MIKKLYREIVFFFRYMETIRMVKTAGANSYPLLVLLEFSKEEIKALYMASGDYLEVMFKFLEDAEKKKNRNIYKLMRRQEMQEAVGFDYETWQARVASWRQHIEISEAIKKQESYDKENTGPERTSKEEETLS